MRPFIAPMFVVALLLSAAPARAEWQFKPFAGVTFGGFTNYGENLDAEAGTRKLNYGGSVTWLGELVGIEGDVGQTPGFFTRGEPLGGRAALVLSSRVTTMTGNVIVALPRRIAQYTLRPYVVGGAGLIRAFTADSVDALPLSHSETALDLGGGATGFVSDRIGLNWDVRYFRTFQKGFAIDGVSYGPNLSFWRVSMGLTIRP